MAPERRGQSLRSLPLQVLPGGGPPLIRHALRRLATALSLAVGVSALLFFVLDSGLLGDPALREAGRHAGPTELGLTRLRLGRFEAFEPAVLRLSVRSGRLTVEADREKLRLGDGAGRTLARIETAGRDLAAVATELAAAVGGAGRVEVLGDPGRTGSGLALALAGGRAVAEPGRPAELGWARAVPGWRRFLGSTLALLRFDLGRDRDGRPIAAQLWRRGRRSLALALPAFLLTTLLAVAAAIACALRGGWLDRLLAGLSVATMSVSSLVWVLLLQDLLAGRLGWFPVHGWQPPWLPYLALPVLIWLIVGFGPELRFYRAVALEEASRPWLRAALARGLSPAQAARRHLLPNLLLQVLTQVLVALPFLMLGSLLLESFFGIPGLGAWTVQAVLDNDQAVIRATTFLVALAWLALQWLTDLAGAWVDPRLRRKT